MQLPLNAIAPLQLPLSLGTTGLYETDYFKSENVSSVNTLLKVEKFQRKELVHFITCVIAATNIFIFFFTTVSSLIGKARKKEKETTSSEGQRQRIARLV